MTLTVVVGFGPWATEVALRHVARHVDPRDAIAILDGRGTGARVAPATVLGRLAATSLTWFDLSDRRRPVALFGVPVGPARCQLLAQTVASIARLRGVAVDEVATTRLSEAADRAAGEQGLVTLATLLDLVRSGLGAAAWLDDPGADAGGVLGALGEALAWSLRFASVNNMSDGAHRARLDQVVAKPGVRWFELPLSGFEPLEHALVQMLCRHALQAALERASEAARSRGGRLVVLDLCPSWTRAPAVDSWIAALPAEAKLIAAVHVDARRGIAAADRRLIAPADHALVCGLPEGSRVAAAGLPGVPSAWADALGRLRCGQVAVLGPDGAPALTVRLDYGAARAVAPPTVEALRWRSAASRPLSPRRQVSEGAPSAGWCGAMSDGLFERITTPEGLRTGWFHVRRTGARATGTDGVTITAFAAALPEALGRLSDDLRSGTYRPQPLRRLYLPKPDGERRAIGIPAVRDRVAQAAVLHHLEPLWEPRFSPSSFAFRPRRGAHDALALAQEYADQGLMWTLSADVEKCFDRVDHDILLRQIHERVNDLRVLRLVRAWVENEVMELGEVFGSDIGVPQGSVLSPFLANIYLHPLDEALAGAGLKFIRYADDLLIHTASAQDAKAARDLLEATLGERLEMRLKPAKTRIAHLEGGVRFLGFELLPGTRRIGAPALDRIRQRLDDLFAVLATESRPGPIAGRALDELDAVVAGWRGYFAERLTTEVAGQLSALDEEVVVRAGSLPLWLVASARWARRALFLVPAPTPQAPAPTGTYPELPGPPAPLPAAARPGEAGCAPSPREAVLNVDRRDMQKGQRATTQIGVDVPGTEVALLDGRFMVLAHGAYLGVDGDALVVRRRRDELGRASLVGVVLVLMDGLHQRIGTDAQIACADRGIPIVVTGVGGRPVGVFEPVTSRRTTLRAQQVIEREAPRVVAAGLEMLSAKVSNQAALLKYFAKYQRKVGSPLAVVLTEAAGEVQEAARRIAALDVTTPALRAVAMGHEGRGAATYWRGFAQLLPGSLSFPGRRTRGATDLGNQCLNYVYGVLYGEVWQAVVSYGLDPYFGIMHGGSRDGGSLVFDLVEELRAPFADRTIAALLGRGFVPRPDRYGGLLTSTRHALAFAFVRGFTRRRVRRGSRRETGAAILGAQVRSVAAMYQAHAGYRAYRMQW